MNKPRKYKVSVKTWRDAAIHLGKLIYELAEAVDNAQQDIGGSRPQLTILRDAVRIATSIKTLDEAERSST